MRTSLNKYGTWSTLMEKRSKAKATIPLGKPEAAEISNASGRLMVLDMHKPPVSSIGTRPCRFPGLVSSADMKPLQEMSGLPIEGFLAMDVLGEHIIRVDFDKGELEFLKSVPPDSGTAVPMYWEPGDVPRVTGFLTGSERLRFVIDTGHVGFTAGTINQDAARKLVAGKKLREFDSIPTQGVGRSWSTPTLRGTSWLWVRSR